MANNLCPRYTYCIYIHQATVKIHPPSVYWSVGLLVGRSVGWLAGRAVNISLKGSLHASYRSTCVDHLDRQVFSEHVREQSSS